jgi:transposase
MEQFEQIRRDRDREGLSIRGLAARHGVHRRAVKQALASPLPPVKRSPVGRSAPKLGEFREVIDGWLLADRTAPRKQRHTAKRIHQRLVDEFGADVAESSVRQHVRLRKRELGFAVGEVFIPQEHAPGAEAEVDWGQADVVLGGVAVKVHLFVMRASFSGAVFCQASLVESQQAFLELHVQAFEWFGGVFPKIRFDNLKSAVKKVLKGRRRVESDRFVAPRSHYLFQSQFMTPGIEGAHQNALAESFVDTFKTELIRDRVWRTRGQMELAVLEWVHWFNHHRLHESLGDVPPVEIEDAYYAQLFTSPPGSSLTSGSESGTLTKSRDSGTY